MPWSKYFPVVQGESSYSRSNKVDTSKNPTPKQIAKQGFKDNIKVLGLTNKKTCDSLGIQSFAVKNPQM